MNRQDAYEKIADAAKTIYTYCVSRTASKEEAEDLSQEILLEVMRSCESIRDSRAFYGFMWAVAGNVYKNWCKKRYKIEPAVYSEDIPDLGLHIDSQLEDQSDISLLRRELSLLSVKYRQAIVLYYVEKLPVSKISRRLKISESMVKYLLFKARNILKEGMSMERNLGEQSYNPKQLSLMYLGEGPNQFYLITKGKKIPQNILWACYNDSLSEENISLQIGVAMPYLEAEIKTLVDAGLLFKKGRKYSTNIIIITKQFKQELLSTTAKQQDDIAEKLYRFICENEEKIRHIGFYGSKMSKNTFLWQMTCTVLGILFGKVTETYIPKEFPITAFGERAYVWGEEEPISVFNICSLSRKDGLPEGEIRFLDWLENPISDNNHFYRNRRLAAFFVKLAANKVTNPNEYEKEMLAELIQKGYAFNDNGSIKVTTFVYTLREFMSVYNILLPVIDELMENVESIIKTTENILHDHVPSYLKEQVNSISCMRMFDEVVCRPAQIMHRNDYLKASWTPNEMATVYTFIDG